MCVFITGRTVTISLPDMPLRRGENAELWKNKYGGILKYGSHTDTQLGWFKNFHR